MAVKKAKVLNLVWVQYNSVDSCSAFIFPLTTWSPALHLNKNKSK